MKCAHSHSTVFTNFHCNLCMHPLHFPIFTQRAIIFAQHKIHHENVNTSKYVYARAWTTSVLISVHCFMVTFIVCTETVAALNPQLFHLLLWAVIRERDYYRAAAYIYMSLCVYVIGFVCESSSHHRQAHSSNIMGLFALNMNFGFRNNSAHLADRWIIYGKFRTVNVQCPMCTGFDRIKC